MNIVLLYGPPSSGKGTHARLLQEFFGYTLVEPAHVFRAIASDPSHKWYSYIGEKINNGFPTPTDAYKKIVGEEVVELLQKKKSFILDKPGGSLLNEVRWFLKLIAPFRPQVFLFELHIPLAESLRRIAARYFITSTGESYITYEEALCHCPSGEKPVKRIDDLDTKKAERRYKLLYQNKHQAVKQLFSQAGAIITEINALEDILTVQTKIRNIIQSYE